MRQQSPRRSGSFKLKPIAALLASSFATFVAAPTFAQSAPAADTASDVSKVDKADNALQLDRIVITGTSSGRSKMRSSVAISTIEGGE